ncbi:hypothetical protein [Enterovibrio nigricans]|uniref:Uncharacterized protein n=1 Tax=Enterovibrio nigricans DSM 22720 TaxID=1121868 RepID=A0A1T4VVY7_9GAMM|nr:hypothetical protein [Enterovibrio nigricans]PKF49278.1 hypothetical protein AT251_20020 [Enterovibrio nigricans]SKA69162.1 hypothetical protein SAMN02745132_04412 [Enterovibrio nigricans DSM 22720]
MGRKREPVSVDVQTGQNIVVLQVDMLPITIDEYARRTEQDVVALHQQKQRGTLPVIQAGRGCKVYVNQAKLIIDSLIAAGFDVQLANGLSQGLVLGRQRQE